MSTPERTAALQRVGRGLSDPTRVRVLLELASGPAYPSELADSLGMRRSNLSNHLTCLRGCGLVKAVVEGRNARYELADPTLGRLLRELSEVAVAEHCDSCDGRLRRSA